MRLIPLYTLVKGDTSATKDIQSTANSQINLALAAGMNLLQILETSCTPRVRNRDCAPLKAIDMRMQSIGAKSSLYQQKMPSAHRKGIKAKASAKDDKRRREAKENGIILEKSAPKSKPTSTKRRERGVGGSSIGKFTGRTLNLSQRDYNSITGSGKKSSKGRRR